VGVNSTVNSTNPNGGTVKGSPPKNDVNSGRLGGLGVALRLEIGVSGAKPIL